MKKRLLVFVAACSMMISMTGCGGSDKKETTAEVEINEPKTSLAKAIPVASKKGTSRKDTRNGVIKTAADNPANPVDNPASIPHAIQTITIFPIIKCA